MTEYKTIKVSTKGNKCSLALVGKVFSSFPREDIFFEATRHEIIVSIRQLDFYSFKEAVLRNVDTGDGDESNILSEILERVENIRSYGLQGKKRLYVGYDKERKVQGRKEKEKERGMYFYASDNAFSKTSNKLPDKYVNAIIRGDSEKVLQDFPDNCVDIIFTSPPYNFGLEYENHTDGTCWEEYFQKLFGIFSQCIRVLKYGGRIIVNVQPLFSDYIPIHHIVSDFFMRNKLIWKGEIIWDKHNWNCKYTAWGSWKSPSNPYLKYTWEFMEIFCKGALKKDGERSSIDITADEFKKYVNAKWDIAPERNMKEYGHPAMFPESLVAQSLKLFSYKGDIVLDPFNGVGTTTAVAKKLSRIFVGIDISEKYCRKAEERLKMVHPNVTIFD